MSETPRSDEELINHIKATLQKIGDLTSNLQHPHDLPRTDLGDHQLAELLTKPFSET